jgi:hypothetical protein
MHLEPYIFPTTETVTLTSGNQTYFYTVSVYIVFVNTSSSWVWLYNSSSFITIQPSPAYSSTSRILQKSLKAYMSLVHQ